MTPQVSILMASYNYAEYIGEAIDSVLAQTFTDWELIVIDDGSTDHSRDIIAAYDAQDPRITLHTHADGGNHGLSKTLQLGLKHARGEYIAFLESDDVWMPLSLEQKITPLQQTTSAGLVFSDIHPLDGTLRSSLYDLLQRLRKQWKPNTPYCYAAYYPYTNIVPTFSCSICSKSLLINSNWDSPIDKWLDWWIFSQLSMFTCFIHIPSQLTLWRIHNKSYSYTPDYKLRTQFVSQIRKILLSNLKYHFNFKSIIGIISSYRSIRIVRKKILNTKKLFSRLIANLQRVY